MNKGIKIATGEYLLFLNSGDYLLHPWTLQEVFDEIKSSNYADVYYSDCIKNDFGVYKYPPKITLDFFIHTNISHQNSLISRELFNHQLYNENYRMISDWYFYITELIRNNITFSHINTNIAIYAVDGITHTQGEFGKAERRKALDELHITEKGNTLLLVIKKKKKIKYLLPYGLYLLYKKMKKHIENRMNILIVDTNMKEKK
jgi:glycosyltransferase involved in cell wall biosynthesis